LQAVEKHVFTPEAIEQVIALTERDELRERQELLEAEYRDLECRNTRLTAVLETDEGRGLMAAIERLRANASRIAAITRELDALQPVPRLPKQVVQSRLDEWRRLLRASTTQGRAVLQRVIQGRITFTPTKHVIYQGDSVFPDQPGYEFEAPTRFDKLFHGVAIKLPATTPYKGELPVMTSIEDADYGAMLERAYGRAATLEGLRPQRDSNPCFGLERATS
jgi:hypothetical protein